MSSGNKKEVHTRPTRRAEQMLSIVRPGTQIVAMGRSAGQPPLAPVPRAGHPLEVPAHRRGALPALDMALCRYGHSIAGQFTDASVPGLICHFV